MKQHWKFVVKACIFLSILGLLLNIYFHIITPQFLYDDSWPTTATYLGFYEMEKNSIDVLFFGSSHSAAAFIPQEIYNQYGIRSYNLSCEQQNMITSYYWLKEALRFQNPKVVVLDCLMLFDYKTQEPLNSVEACTRKAFDYMKWSLVKIEAVHTIGKEDENQSEISYYMPNIRYHSRWTGLTANDFKKNNEHYELKGFAPQFHCSGEEEDHFFLKGSTGEMEKTNDLMEKYFDKFVQLCKDNQMELLFVKTPYHDETIQKYNTIEAYAAEHGLCFIDMNEQAVYKETGLAAGEDMGDSAHSNIWGAKKMSAYIGNILSQGYHIESRQDEQWEKTKKYYEHVLEDGELIKSKNIDEYLCKLYAGLDRYDIFVSVKGDASAELRDSTIENMKMLGLEATLKDLYEGSYIAVISDQEVIERVDLKCIEKTGAIEKGLIPYYLMSAGYVSGNASSIKIYDQEYSLNREGLNFVIYSRESKKVIDSKAFNTSIFN